MKTSKVQSVKKSQTSHGRPLIAITFRSPDNFPYMFHLRPNQVQILVRKLNYHMKGMKS
jgi:hypothetical protein